MTRLLTVRNVKNSTVCRYRGSVDSQDERLMRPLPSAEVALYRREGWREGERKRAGDDGKVRGRGKAPTFSVFLSSPARLLFSTIDIVIGIPSRSLYGGESYAPNGTRNSFRADPTK